MKVSDINDENCMVEVMLERMMNHEKFEADKIGYMKNIEQDEVTEFGIYYVWNNSTNRFIVVFTDIRKYNDKRIKKKTTKEKRSMICASPMQSKYLHLSECSFDATLNYFSGESTDITFGQFPSYEDITNYMNLKNNC